MKYGFVRKAGRVLIVVTAVMTAGCGTLRGVANVSPESLGALKEGQARIIFTRVREPYGARITHLLVDTGTGMENNATLVQNTELPAARGNIETSRNVKYLDCTLQENGKPVFYRLVGRTRPADAAPNAIFLGTAASGRTLAWDRNPGRMRLHAITPTGDQASAAPLEVKAGKTYKVKYWYMKAMFEVTAE